MPAGFALDDRRHVRLRDMHQSDRALYERAIAGLSPRSRYMRFAAPIPVLSKSMLEQMMRFDGTRHVAYAALTLDETEIVGVARYVMADRRRSAEVAIAIADRWQGRRLGSELLSAIVGRASAAGLDSLTATALSENRAAARLARAAGFAVVDRAGIQTEYELRLSPVAGSTTRRATDSGEAWARPASFPPPRRDESA